ncbi:helix-turn-helix domain-containing protein [Brachyspira sp.]|uniref:helix-turn-helix domain-containing protein n=1 Tax=Brachyspira sp. TaxID=1977261 RepID=UPI00260852C9|nr:helix-turn-helix domain-containing protein [Brachyspira sp.]
MPNYKYTKEDYAILNSYKQFSESLGVYLGENVEIVLYSFENDEYTILFVVNEYLKNKKIGDVISDKDKNVLNELLNNNLLYKNYFLETVIGECQKINYMIIKNSDEVPIAMIVMSWYYDTSLINTLKIFIPDNINDNIKDKQNRKSEDIILDAIKKVMSTVDKSEVGPSVYNKTIIKKLFNQGIFEFKEAVQLVSNYLNISHHTVYLHLRSIKKRKK